MEGKIWGEEDVAEELDVVVEEEEEEDEEVEDVVV